MSQPMALLLLVMGLLVSQIKPLGACNEEGSYPSICKLPQVVGPCKASFLNYYFDFSTKKCIPFIYGGCDGNANNFPSLRQCYSVCEKYGSL